MLNSLAKRMAPWILALALAILAGALPAANSLAAAGESRVNLCCQHEADAPALAAESDYSAFNCHCFSCNDPLLVRKSLTSPLLSLPHSHHAWSRFVPTVSGSTIEYPPEIF